MHPNPRTSSDGCATERARAAPVTAPELAEYFLKQLVLTSKRRQIRLRSDAIAFAPLRANLKRWLDAGISAVEIQLLIDDFVRSADWKRQGAPAWKLLVLQGRTLQRDSQ